MCTISTSVDKAEQTEMTFSTECASQTSDITTVDFGTFTHFFSCPNYLPLPSYGPFKG